MNYNKVSMHLYICKQINAIEWMYMQIKTYATYKCKKKKKNNATNKCIYTNTKNTNIDTQLQIIY